MVCCPLSPAISLVLLVPKAMTGFVNEHIFQGWFSHRNRFNPIRIALHELGHKFVSLLELHANCPVNDCGLQFEFLLYLLTHSIRASP